MYTNRKLFAWPQTADKLGNSKSEWTELLIGVPQGSIPGPLNFIFVNDIFYIVGVFGVCIVCSKASAQISALQRSTGLVDYQSRKAIYTSFVASNFNYSPLVWFFTSGENVDMIDKIQERALRFVVKDHISDYKNLSLKSGFDSFRIYAVKCLMIKLYSKFEKEWHQTICLTSLSKQILLMTQEINVN